MNAAAPPPPPPPGNFSFGHGIPAAALNLENDDEVSQRPVRQIPRKVVSKQAKLYEIFSRATKSNHLVGGAINSNDKNNKRPRSYDTGDSTDERTASAAVKCSDSDSLNKTLETLIELDTETQNSPPQKRQKVIHDIGSQEHFDMKYFDILRKLNPDTDTNRDSVGIDVRNWVYFSDTASQYQHDHNICTDNNVFDYTFQDEASELPTVAKSIWRQARSASVDAAKIRERQVWYAEAIARNLYEPWTAVLDKMPPFANRRELLVHITRIRRNAAMDIMRATETFLKDELTRLTGMSAGHMVTVERLITQAFPNDPDKATEIHDRATAVIKATVDREKQKEHRNLEERSRELSLRRPQENEMADPLSVTSSTRQSGNQNEFGRPFRGRGTRGARRPRGRRPGRRGYNN